MQLNSTVCVELPKSCEDSQKNYIDPLNNMSLNHCRS